MAAIVPLSLHPLPVAKEVSALCSHLLPNGIPDALFKGAVRAGAGRGLLAVWYLTWLVSISQLPLSSQIFYFKNIWDSREWALDNFSGHIH